MSQSKDQRHHISLSDASELSHKLFKHIESMIFGQSDLIMDSLCTFLAGGHILITGAPGLAKTTLVRVISDNLGLKFGRVQFTPDLLPSDIIGSEVLNIDTESGKRSFDFVQGPVFVNLLLADEINRASPRTQSAMLESMQEHQVTVGGKEHKLPSPFMVFATQNPFESEGTFPLPEAQLDRFLMHSLVDYPDKDAELKILSAHATNELIGESGNENPSRVLTNENIEQLLHRSKGISCDPKALELINDLIRSTRPEDDSCPEDIKNLIWYGAGPRAGISLISASRSYAMVSQDESVRWKHIKRMAKPVLRHRIRLATHSMQEEFNEDKIIESLIATLEQKHHLE